MKGRTLPALSLVTPLNSSETMVNAMLSVPKNLRIVWKSAPPKPPCPDGYDGNGGVKFGPVRLLAGGPIGVDVVWPLVDALTSPRRCGPGPGLGSRCPP